MLDNVTITNKGSYLLFEYTGLFTVEKALACIDLEVEFCIKHEIYKVLLDVRKMEGPLKIIERYEVGTYAEKTAEHKIITALVGRQEYILPDNFLENVTLFRGVIMKVFTDIDEALEWLKR